MKRSRLCIIIFLGFVGLLCCAGDEQLPDQTNDSLPSDNTLVDEKAPLNETIEEVELFQLPANISGHFVETFQDGEWKTRWTLSSNTKYAGVFECNEPTPIKVLKGDRHLIMRNQSMFHAVYHVLDKSFSAKEKGLLIQYEVTPLEKISCGGAYLKLLSHEMSSSLTDFSDKTPYTIMFGPDKCGNENKVRFVFRHQNPITKEWQEKHMVNSPKMKNDQKTHLYALHIKPDNTFDIYIDQERIRSGNLLTDFSPAVNPPEQIPDPTDTKPSNWVDAPKIPDMSVEKPTDWDELNPRFIPDGDAVKPDDWDESIMPDIPNPDAGNTEHVNEDGSVEWKSPIISNPLCVNRRCGPWIPPMKPNPGYKGEWAWPLIDNPAYKGEWKPRLIPNPNHFDDKNPSHFPNITGIGFELWTVNSGISFDNIYLGDSLEDASFFANQTFKPKEALQSNRKSSNATDEQNPYDAKALFNKAFEYSLSDPLGFAGIVFLLTVPLGIIFTPPTQRPVPVQRQTHQPETKDQYHQTPPINASTNPPATPPTVVDSQQQEGAGPSNCASVNKEDNVSQAQDTHTPALASETQDSE